MISNEQIINKIRAITIVTIAFLVIFNVIIISTYGFTTTEITKPTSLSFSESVLINISGNINITGFPYLARRNGVNHSQVVGVNILNHSGSSTDSYGILASSLSLTINASNGTPTFWNFTATFRDGRHWIKLNFTNVSRQDNGAFGGALTSERIIQIDVNRDIINVGNAGTINLSMTPGDINISGRLHMGGGNLSLHSGGGTKFNCGPDDTGSFSCTA